MDFNQLIKDDRIMRALKDLEWEEPTPVQEQVLPLAFQNADVMAQAQTDRKSVV